MDETAGRNCLEHFFMVLLQVFTVVVRGCILHSAFLGDAESLFLVCLLCVLSVKIHRAGKAGHLQDCLR